MQLPRGTNTAFPDEPLQAHDVFLSHSGAQKGFVKDLYHKLTSYGFHPFLDVEYHSLPLAESFPQRIFAAASSCKLAVVVLTNDYLSSKWPMLELCAFMHASTTTVKILPLFFHLSPSDLKKKGNLKKWHRKWMSFAELDHRIKVDEWEEALKSLCSLNGITYAGVALEGEQSFIERIVDSICVSGTLVPQDIYDSSYMQGRARLHQTIVDKFEEMESGEQHGIHAGPSSSPSSRHTGIASVLGIYGIPGSGKSALCRSLQGYFFSQYPGKSLYLELPTNATPSNLVDLISRTFNLNVLATHIDQVMSSLKSHQLWRKPMFLVVDNIRDETCEVVQRILRYVMGPGSRVVLAARTLDLLRPALVVTASSLVGHEQLTCICDSMPMPSINEEEAIKLLLETTGQGCGTMEPHAIDYKDKVLTVVRMCGFHPTRYSSSELKYLPLVVRTMGAMLMRYGKDVDGWMRDQVKFWNSFNDQDLKIYRKDAVHMLILESFKESLDAQQQLLFLDVALFLQPSKVRTLNEACSILGAMHGEDATLIEKLLKDLKRMCFIDSLHEYCGVAVHDVYVEFAESIQMKGFVQWSYTRSRDIQWDESTVEMKLEQENTKRPVRAMTFEVKEGCETVDLKNFSSLKAIVMRDCRSLVLFRMAGLTSLAILNITGFRELPRLECYDYDLHTSVQNVKMLKLESGSGKLGNAMNKWQQRSSVANAYLQDSSIINLFCLKMNKYAPAFLKQPSSLEITKHMKGLQVLHLRKTGISNLDDILGSCSWPHLQELYVKEYLLERFRLSSLPALKRLYFQSCPEKLWISRGPHKLKHKREFVLEGKDLLKGCPDLQDVSIISDLFKNVGLMKPTWRGMRQLRLSDVDSAMEFEDLASSAHTLEHLTIDSCKKIERVYLSAGQLPSLTQLCIVHCNRFVEVEFGFSALPRLSKLDIRDVSELCVLRGVEELRLLEELHLACCSMLQTNHCLSGLVLLKRLSLAQSPRAWEFQRALDFKSAGFEGLSNLEELEIAASDLSCGTAPLNLAILTNLVDLKTDGTLVLEGMSGLQKLRTFRADYELDAALHREAGGLNFRQQFKILRSRNFLGSAEKHIMQWPMLVDENIIPSMQWVTVESLTRVSLQFVEQMRRLDGLECLIHLQVIELWACPLLEELPSLHALQELETICILSCGRLKAVEGCDDTRNLSVAIFQECHRMEQVPFKDMYALGCTHPFLRRICFEGTRFAMDRAELLVEWARVSSPLGEACLEQLLWEHNNINPDLEVLMDDKERLEEAIVSCLLSLTLLPILRARAAEVRIFGAWRILVERVLAGKVKKDLLHPSLLARLSGVLKKHIHIWPTSDHQAIRSIFSETCSQ